MHLNLKELSVGSPSKTHYHLHHKLISKVQRKSLCFLTTLQVTPSPPQNGSLMCPRKLTYSPPLTWPSNIFMLPLSLSLSLSLSTTAQQFKRAKNPTRTLPVLYQLGQIWWPQRKAQKKGEAEGGGSWLQVVKWHHTVQLPMSLSHHFLLLLVILHLFASFHVLFCRLRRMGGH